MAVDVVTEVEIARARMEVAAFSADPINATAWYKNIKAVEWETPPPVAVGSKLRFRAQFLGRTLEYMYKVRELNPARRFVMATAQGPFPMETTYEWEDAAPGRTKMTLRNRGSKSREQRTSCGRLRDGGQAESQDARVRSTGPGFGVGRGANRLRRRRCLTLFRWIQCLCGLSRLARRGHPARRCLGCRVS